MSEPEQRPATPPTSWDDLDWGQPDESRPSAEETDRGWGEPASDDETWLREQIPPHHDTEAR